MGIGIGIGVICHGFVVTTARSSISIDHSHHVTEASDRPGPIHARPRGLFKIGTVCFDKMHWDLSRILFAHHNSVTMVLLLLLLFHI